jgi:hypothetical protein
LEEKEVITKEYLTENECNQNSEEKIAVSGDVTPCNLVDHYKRVGKNLLHRASSFTLKMEAK